MRKLSLLSVLLLGLTPALGQAQAKPYGPGTGSAAQHMASTAAMSCAARSPKNTVGLLELFTSEGCSSCPPADRWLQSLSNNGYGFDKVVPLSLHVGYWDYIGWKDPYAQQRFTDRQREYSRLRQAGSVYTPQVVLAGNDFPGWSGSAFARDLAALNSKPSSANIELEAAAVGSAVQFKARAQTDAINISDGAKLHLAIFEMGLKNKVTRGENSGETLTHDFVVRQWHGPLALNQGTLSAKEVLTLDAPSAGRSLGMAAFVQNTRGAVLQATACVMQ